MGEKGKKKRGETAKKKLRRRALPAERWTRLPLGSLRSPNFILIAESGSRLRKAPTEGANNTTINGGTDVEN